MGTKYQKSCHDYPVATVHWCTNKAFRNVKSAAAYFSIAVELGQVAQGLNF